MPLAFRALLGSLESTGVDTLAVVVSLALGGRPGRPQGRLRKHTSITVAVPPGTPVLAAPGVC